MQTHTQLKVFFAAVLIALATLTIVTTPAQVVGVGRSKRSAVVALPPDAGEVAPALGSAVAGADTAKHVSDSQLPRRIINSRAITSSSFLFRPAVDYNSPGPASQSVAVADLNGDGRLDLVVASTGGPIGVLLGNGDGTFQTAIGVGGAAISVAVADLNGDGKPDLVVATLTSTIGVLLGNGDGSFGPEVPYASGGPFSTSVAIADVNGDGKPDLVVTSEEGQVFGGLVDVLLGNGDGTFQPAVTYASGGGDAWSVAVVDVNGDGKPDLVVANMCSKSNCSARGVVSVLLGNGNGTFQPAVTYESGGLAAFSVAVADLNGDGTPDIAVVNVGSANVGVLLGNGDGTFQPAVTYAAGGILGNGPQSVALADVNGDGKRDLILANCAGSGSCGATDGFASVLLGNGNGTFQPAVTYGSGGFSAWAVAAADVNGDGRPDLVVANYCGETYCTNGSVGVLLNDTGLNATTTTLVSSLNPSAVGQAVTFTATVGSTAGTPRNGETITFYNGLSVLGTATLSGGMASLTTSSLPAGIFTITATYPGDTTTAASTSPGLNQVVTKFMTSTALASSLNPSAYGQKVTWAATVTSSGSITPTGKVLFEWSIYTIGSATLNSSGVATLTKSNLNADAFPLTAVYAGDAANLGSTSAVLSQVVLEATSAATLTSSPNPSAQGQAVTFTAKITSPTVTPKGPVTFTAGTTVLGTAQLSAGKATLTISSLAVGSTTVTATYYGDSNIAKSSASVTQTVH
jgi:hypothetical protein